MAASRTPHADVALRLRKKASYRQRFRDVFSVKLIHQSVFRAFDDYSGKRGHRVTFRQISIRAASRLLGGSLLAASLALPAFAVDEQALDVPADMSAEKQMEGRIDISVDGIQGRSGTVRVNLYASADAFLAQEDAKAEVAVMEDGVLVVSFTDLAPGSYAFVAYQDINGNGELDRGLFGIPLEPLGFSNGVVPVFSAPDFEDAAVAVVNGLTEIDITVRNLTGSRRAGS